MDCRISNNNNSGKLIQSRVESVGLYLFPNLNKVSTVEYVPSDEKVKAEYSKILESNPEPKMLSKGERRIMSRDAQFRHHVERTKEISRREIKCRKEFFENPIIKSYLLRNDVTINEFNIPEYSDAERQICFFPKVAYIACRNPDVDRAYDDPVFLDKEDSVAMAYEAFKKVIKNNESLGPILAYNLVAIGEEGNVVLIKNKRRFDIYKMENFSAFSGIHYVEHQMGIRDIFDFIEKIELNEIELDDRVQNVWILAINYDGHTTCGALVVDRLNSSFMELIMFDSLVNDEGKMYGSDFMQSVNGFKPDNKIKFIYIPYGVQPEDQVHDYDADVNCFFYSVYTMNALIRILAFSKDSPLQARLLNERATDKIDNEEDIEIYTQELRKELPFYFNFDEALGASTVKPFNERQCVNIANRWRLGRQHFKEYFAQLSTI